MPTRLALFLACMLGMTVSLQAQEKRETRPGANPLRITECHGEEEAEAGLDFEALLLARPIVKHRDDWKNAAFLLEHRFMPPADSKQPDILDSEITRIRADPIDNPCCTESLMSAMRDETAMFFVSLVRNNQPIARLIDARYTFFNEELARFYRIDGVKGPAMRRVELKTPQPGGLIGQLQVSEAMA